MNDRFPIKLADAPNMINIAGPMQQDAAKNDAISVPKLDMFSVFISVYHNASVLRPQQTKKSVWLSANLPMNDSVWTFANAERILSSG